MTFDAIAENFEEWNTMTNFKVIAIAVQSRDDRTIEFIKKRNWPFEVYFDQDYELFRTLLTNYDHPKSIQYGFPTIFIFDRYMNMVDKIVGSKTKLKKGVELPKEGGAMGSDFFEADLNFYYDYYEKIKNL